MGAARFEAEGRREVKILVEGEALGTAEPRETSGLTTALILSYVRERKGESGVTRLLQRAGQSERAEVLVDESSWSSYATKIALFEAAAEVLDDRDVAWNIGAAVLADREVAAPVRALVRTLGSPQQILRTIARTSGKFSTVGSMQALKVRPGRALVAYRLLEPHRPSAHDCRYTQGLLSQTPVLFDGPPAIVRELECQLRGDARCLYEVTWNARTQRLRRLLRPSEDEHTYDLVQRQLRDLQRAGAELVRCRDLDLLLERITALASSAVRAQRFLLAVNLDGESRPRIHSDGFAPGAERHAGHELLAGGQAPAHNVLITEVASNTRRYGRLAAYLPTDHEFFPGEQDLLDAYAALAAAALDTATALEEARRRGQRAEALLTLARRLIAVSDEHDAAEALSAAIPPVLGASCGSVLLWRPEEKALVCEAQHGLPSELAVAAEGFRIELEEAPHLHPRLVSKRAAVFGRDDPDPFVREALALFSTETVVVAPIVVRGELLGTLNAHWLVDAPAPAAGEDVLRDLSSLADHAGLALANLRMLADVRHQATHDALTGLANRVLFLELLTDALARGERDGHRTAVCFLDLDLFKHVNDNHGHAAGDAVLIEVARRLGATVRKSDVVARLSGDEFGLVLHGAGVEEHATAVADKVVEALARPFEVAPGVEVQLGVSVGIAIAPEHGRTPEELLAHADAAMYEAKASGGTHRVYRVDA